MGGKKNTWLVTLAPMCVMFLVWCVQFIYYEIIGNSVFNSVSLGTWGIAWVGVFGYVIGALICSVFTVQGNEESVVYFNRSFYYLKCVCLILAVAVILNNLVLPVLNGVSVSALRNQAIDEWTSGSIGPRVNAVLLNGLCCFIVLLISLMYEVNKKLSFFWVAVFAVLCVACFSRTLLLIGLSILLLRVLLQGEKPLRMIFFSLLCFVVLFLVLAWVMKDKTPGNESPTDVLLHHLQIYFFGGVSGFNYYVINEQPNYNSLLTVPRFIQALLPLDLDFPPSFYDFVETPGTLNVFTSMFPPYHDFGVLGVLLFFLMYGSISTVACVRFVKTNKSTWQVMAGFFIYATVMTIFDDQFVRGLPVILIFIFFARIFDSIRSKCLSSTESEY